MSGTTQRRGFGVIEVVVALAAFAVIMLITAQVATYSMLERIRIAARQAAVEQTANVLEAARLEAPEALTPDWAVAHQQLPAESALPPDSRVRIEIEPERAGTRRLSVEVRWNFISDEPEQSVRLVGVFGPRAATGGKR
jgi:prepilin-type N-terminal cleavage/methylation domain-containing protein